MRNICLVHYFHVKKEFFFFFHYHSVVFTPINVNQVSVSLVNTMMLSGEILVAMRERKHEPPSWSTSLVPKMAKRRDCVPNLDFVERVSGRMGLGMGTVGMGRRC